MNTTDHEAVKLQERTVKRAVAFGDSSKRRENLGWELKAKVDYRRVERRESFALLLVMSVIFGLVPHFIIFSTIVPCCPPLPLVLICLAYFLRYIYFMQAGQPTV